MQFRFWPRTLRVQLILVVAAAVAISNICVAFYFYKKNEAQARNFTIDRIVDRTVAVAATASQVTPDSRLAVMRFMSQQYVRFREVRAGYDTKPMTAEETGLARRIADALPEHHPRKKAVIVHLHEAIANIPQALRPFNAATAKPGTEVVQTIVPIDARSVVSGVYLRPTPAWPIEIMIAALLAVVAASASAAFMARRVVRPLSELTNAAAKVAVGTDAPHVAEQGP